MLDTIKVKNFIESLTREEGILCSSQEQANKIIRTAMELGYSWINKDRADTQWNTYKERTCYFFNPDDKQLSYSSKEYAEKEELIFYTMDKFESIMLVELMNAVEQTKKTLKNINYNWNIDEANITDKQKIKLYTDGKLKLKFIENPDENPNLTISYHDNSLWLYDKHSQTKHIFRADKDDENITINYNQYNLNDCDFKDLIELLEKVENLFNQEVERVKNKQIKEFSKTIQAYNKLM